MNKTPFFINLSTKAMLITVTTGLIIGVVVYLIVYTLSYNQMIDSFKKHSEKVFEYTTEILPDSSFEELNNKSDEKKELYITLQKKLNTVRHLADVQYLYTVKYDNSGTLIYHIDGLDLDSEDFRHVGDPMEDEFIEPIIPALKGEHSHSLSILETEWGPVFTSYLPVYNAHKKIIGVIGMEFDASIQSTSFHHIRRQSFITMFIILMVAAYASDAAFRKASNPYFKKIAFTDFLTSLKNRTAFEMDLARINNDPNKDGKYVLVVLDLNNLKLVNDSLGHGAGDEYIRQAAVAISESFNDIGTSYRIGGDEFAVIVADCDDFQIEVALENLSFRQLSFSIDGSSDFDFQIAYGYSRYTAGIDNNMHELYVRADNSMYIRKSQQKGLNKTRLEQ